VRGPRCSACYRFNSSVRRRIVDLEGKVAIVTGGARGIGRGISLELAKRGAAMVINYLQSTDAAEDIVDLIHGHAGKAIALRADVSQADQVEQMVNAAIDTFDRIDILVNNAGISIAKSFLEVTEHMWDVTVDTNLKGAFLCSQAVAKPMVEAESGRIINITSVYGIAASADMAHYAASKGGLNMLTRAMALDLAPHGITVNAVAPGAIEVEKHLQRASYDRTKAAKSVPAARVGFPEDVAKAVAFLATDDAAYITGQVLVVDGGMTAALPLRQRLNPEDSYSESMWYLASR